MTALALMCLLSAARAAQTPGKALAPDDKSYGVLLLGDGGDLSWKNQVESIRARMAGLGRPFEFAQGPADAKEIQRAVDRLQRRNVKKIVAVPLYLSSFSDVVDEDRYLFGIRQAPPAAYGASLKRMGAPAQARLKIKPPLVLTRALDDSDELVGLLAERAKALSREPTKEVLVLVGQAPEAKDAVKEWQSGADALAEKVRAKAGLAGAKAAGLSEGLSQKDRDASEGAVKKLVGTLASQASVVVVGLELAQGIVHLRLPRALEGSFGKVDAKPIMPDAKIVDWVAKSADEAAKLPDMRVFKSGGPGFSTISPAQKLDFGSSMSHSGGH